MKKVVVILCLFVLLLSDSEAYAAKEKDIPILLKLNDYYILYTDPHAPFIDKNGRLLIPLKSVRDLMGGTIEYNKKNKIAYVQLLNHHYTFTVGSKTAIVDEKVVEMDTAPVLIRNSMFFPIKFLLEKTDVKLKWNELLGILEIYDERVTSGEIFTFFKDQDYAEVKDFHAFHLISYSIEKVKNGETRIRIKAKNITGHNVPVGKADIHPIFSKGDIFSTDSYTRPMQKPLKMVKKDEIITYTHIFDMKNIDYIISVARELK